MKIIITGCKGFLGNYIINLFHDKYELIGVEIGQHLLDERLKIYTPDEILKQDITADVVIMCHAAVSSGTYQAPTDSLFQANVNFTEQLAKKYKDSYLLYISSVSVYGQQKGTWNETTPCSPDTPYAISKLWGEKIIASYPNYGILRLTSLYGIGMKENTIIPNYIRQAIESNRIEVWGKGTRMQNYVYVEDVVDFIEKMIHIQSQGIHIAASSKEINNAYLAEMISQETNAEIQYINEDNSQSVAIDNTNTKKILQKTTESEMSENLKKYIHWKRKQS